MKAFRYLLMVSPTRDLAEARCATPLADQGYVRLFAHRSIAVFATQRLIQPLSDGLAIGHVFDAVGRRPGESPRAACHVADTAGLFKSFWGSFIAIFWRGAVRVARDPSGTLPCFYAAKDGILYFAHDARTLVEQGALNPSLDWEGVARTLFANDLPERNTALHDVKQLLPGEQLSIDVANAIDLQTLWSPWDYVGAREPSAGELNGLIKACVRRWQQSLGPLLLTVSGGLDSSIVAAAIAAATTSRAITVATDDPHGDESAFARIVTDALDLPLIVARYEMEAVDIDRSSVAHLPRPGGRAQLQAYDAVLAAAAETIAADAVLTGLGGDNVFYFTRSVRPLIDRLLSEGVTTQTAATFMHIVRLTGASPWAAARAALAFRHDRGVPYRWRPDRRLLSREVACAASRRPLDHPWLDAPPGALPGRAAHIAQLIRTQSYVDISDRSHGVAMTHPLLSQPIVEACLAVPSWRFCEGGLDRAVARQAFRDDLPPAVLERRHKGGPDGFAMAIVRQHLPALRARLMEGELARNGIIDRKAIEQCLGDAALQRGDDHVRLLLLLDTEAWVRHWQSRRQP
ncbi:MAG: asparagine synthase-related protein [Sphingomonas sp.]